MIERYTRKLVGGKIAREADIIVTYHRPARNRANAHDSTTYSPYGIFSLAGGGLVKC